MKLLLALGFVGAVAAGVVATNQKAIERANRGPSPTRMTENAELRADARKESIPDMRKFDLDIISIRPGGAALATAAYYDVSPEITTSPEKLPPAKANWTQAGEIYVMGLPSGLVDKDNYLAWLLPSGTKTYTDARGAYHTVHAYTVQIPPPAVEYKPPQGSQMRGSALDQPARR